MASSLFRILYCSRNKIGDLSEQQSRALDQILATARANNSRREVTGALLYNAGYFAQVLEGPRTSIEHIFERIQRDQRHGDVTVLECSGIQLRDFPEWSMARVQPQSEAQAAQTTNALHSAMQDSVAGGAGVLDLLRSLVVQDE